MAPSFLQDSLDSCKFGEGKGRRERFLTSIVFYFSFVLYRIQLRGTKTRQITDLYIFSETNLLSEIDAKNISTRYIIDVVVRLA